MKIIRCLAGLLLISTSLCAQNIVDTTFNPGAGAGGGFVESTVVQPDGKILVCGNFQSFNNSSHKFIARLLSDGSLDTSFNATPSDWVRHMAVQTDGKIVIAGFFKAVGIEKRSLIARLNANGSLDTTFNPGTGGSGLLSEAIDGNTNSFVFQTALQTDGKILITGNFTNYNGTRIHGIARLNTNGLLDTTFNVGSGLSTWGRSIRVLPNHQILVTGWFDNYNNSGHDKMALINPDGSPDSTFNPSFGPLCSVYDTVKLASGQYIAVGHSLNTNDVVFYGKNILRLNANGSVDTSFNASANEKVESVKLQSDGKLVIGGYFTQVNGAQRQSVARLNTDGSLDSSFNANIDNWIWTVQVQSNGKILISGDFHTVNGVSRNGIARLNATGTIPPPVVNVPDPKPGDLLWRGADGRLAVWAMSGTNVTGSGLLAGGAAVPLSWQVVGLADFDHDGKIDLLWRNSDGQTAIWLMNGATIKSTMILPPAVPVAWRVAGVADFNRDGQTDILWQHTGGTIAIWFMQNTALSSSAAFTGPAAYTGWKIAGVGDFDRDGETDFLWQHTNGQLAVWKMNQGTNHLSSVLGNIGPPVSSGWRIAGVRDFNSDNQPDLLWENSQGQQAFWLLNNEIKVFSSFFLRNGQSVGSAWNLSGIF